MNSSSSSARLRTRRELLSSFAIFGGALIASRGLVACAFDGSSNPGDDGRDANASSNDPTDPESETSEALVGCQSPAISDNHGHTLVVSTADVKARITKTYSIKGTSGHDHKVTITTAQFAQLAAGRSVTVVSTNVAGHTHDVTVKCAASNGADAGADSAHPDASTTPDATTSPDASGSDAAVPGDAAPPPTCSQGAKASSISSNHGHVLAVPAADIAAGATKTYSIKGTSSHAHEVTLTAAQLAQLSAGGSITVSSSTASSHAHTVVVVCA